MTYSDFKQVCLESGLPHQGFTIDQELPILLSFFHSLNFVLWYDTDALRDLVILDPSWVIDAVTAFVRDFEMRDHTEGYERMKELDERAKREEPKAWELLTKGSATLQRKLLDLMWSSEEFAPHKDALLSLIVKFGLACPVPMKLDAQMRPTEFLIPAQLRDAPSAASPAGWPPGSPNAPYLRLHFTLEGQAGYEEGTLLHATSELKEGFLPISAFHRLSAAALGCASQEVMHGSAQRRLEATRAYVAFGSELTRLTYVAHESSIMVHLSSDGKGGVAGAVSDQLRVLLAQDVLIHYPNLRCRLLAPLSGSSEGWIDLEELPKANIAKGATELRTAAGETVGIEALKAEMEIWLTSSCEFNFILAEKLRTASEMPQLLRLQELRKTRPDWVVKRTITLHDACSGKLAKEYLAVSHRWEGPGFPDSSDNVQLGALRAHLVAHPELKYVFFDFLCLAQRDHRTDPITDDRTDSEKAEFKAQLPNINLLYMGARSPGASGYAVPFALLDAL